MSGEEKEMNNTEPERATKNKTSAAVLLISAVKRRRKIKHQEDRPFYL